ncbi:hypothetical protein FACS1894208_09780 [Clostridia bacterium]|nr:hypothetical protein FACS1894208_09780 [Clostridia bacterium]
MKNSGNSGSSVGAIIALVVATTFALVVMIWSTFFLPKPVVTNRDSAVQSSLMDALDRAERATKENEILKEKLLEQGFSEDALAGFLADGAERAVQLKNIAEVRHIYDAAWNLPLHVNNFTLVDLYYVGARFILGQYEDDAGRSVWLHMSKTESYEKLSAQLLYEQQREQNGILEYVAKDGNFAGFAFWVDQTDTDYWVRYLASASFTMSADVRDSFIASVVDGTVGSVGAEPADDN